MPRSLNPCVKHLNPRQGITNVEQAHAVGEPQAVECETPKSPPGDYKR